MSITTNLKALLLLCCMITATNNVMAQCCAGGSGSPIAGGASQGVLQERQMELNTNIQFSNTNHFYANDKRSDKHTFDGFSSTYEYFRLAYGLSKNFTMSVESGYYFNKKETGLNGDPLSTYQSKGVGDLILFPRYDILNRTSEKHRSEVTVGLGFKIPLGSYNDSMGNIEPFSKQVYYVTKPTAVQLSSGAQDLIFYTFLFHGFTEYNFRVFANVFYIKKGYNPNGEKLGDFASVAVFAGKTVWKNVSITLQARYEWTDRMKINESTLLFGRPSNYYPEATGARKVFICPQLSYTKGKFTVYAATDLPVYQYLNSSQYYTQIGSQYSTTIGISYRFFTKRSIINSKNSTYTYYCPMHPEETSNKPGVCTKCNMNLEKK